MFPSSWRVGNVGATTHFLSITSPSLLLGDPCTAHSPLDWLIAIVYHDVPPITVLGDKGLATHLTHKRLLLTVYEKVAFQFVLACKGFAAHLTFKRFLACMDHEVLR